MNTEYDNKSESSQSQITSAVLFRIENESIKPKARWRFVLSQFSAWLLWGLTVLFGALSLSVTAYVGLSANYALYEATHTNFLTFFVSVLPYLWIVLFILMTVIAVYELRQTKRGYRYPVVYVMGSSLLLSIIFGVIFHSSGLGFALDNKLGKYMTGYMSLDKIEYKMWQAPAQGRLVGVIEPGRNPDSELPVLDFRDSSGNLWQISVKELGGRDIDLLLSGQRIRLIGTTTSESVFHACGVFPWMFDKAMARKEMERERREFDSVMKKHNRILSEPESDLMPRDFSENDLCSHLEMMKRMGNVRI